MKLINALAAAICFISLLLAAVVAAEEIDVKDFIERAAKMNLAEIEIGKLALEQTDSSEIRAYARKMIVAHASSNRELRIIATQKKIDVETEESVETKVKSFILAQREGEPFDEAYVNNQIKSHNNAIALYTEAADSSDSDVRRFSISTLPILKHHLKMIKALAKTHKSHSMGEKSSSSTSN